MPAGDGDSDSAGRGGSAGAGRGGGGGSEGGYAGFGSAPAGSLGRGVGGYFGGSGGGALGGRGDPADKEGSGTNLGRAVGGYYADTDNPRDDGRMSPVGAIAVRDAHRRERGWVQGGVQAVTTALSAPFAGFGAKPLGAAAGVLAANAYDDYHNISVSTLTDDVERAAGAAIAGHVAGSIGYGIAGTPGAIAGGQAAVRGVNAIHDSTARNNTSFASREAEDTPNTRASRASFQVPTEQPAERAPASEYAGFVDVGEQHPFSEG